jgi:hypothetical protein
MERLEDRKADRWNGWKAGNPEGRKARRQIGGGVGPGQKEKKTVDRLAAR